jgi:hypothetical protein
MLAGGLFLGGVGADAATTVTVTKQAPLESLAADGSVSGVSEAQAGVAYTLVSCANGQVIVRDAQGGEYRLDVTATDYTPPAPAPIVAATNAAPVASTPAPVTNAPPASTTASPPAVVKITPNPGAFVAATGSFPTGNLTVGAVNAAMGKPFFSGQSLWQETALLVAQRLGLGLEGRTDWEASYRRYFSGQPDDPKAVVLGNGAYCIAVYSDAQDHPTSILIAFANDGDFHGIGQAALELEGLSQSLYNVPKGSATALQQDYDNKFAVMKTTFEAVRQSEQQSLTANLTNLFGPPQQTSFGSDADTKEDALRWDWNGASFLLTCEPKRYDLLRIVPIELADNNGRTPRVPRDDIGRRLADAVEHRDNGDVVITQIPMADQGQKGYCVPATWERVLRYTGVPGDMYTLSRIGDAGFGGGENGINLADQLGLQVVDNLDKTLNNYGRHVEILHPTHLDYIALRHYIDQGVPIFWSVNPRGYEAAEQRYSLCDRNKDFTTWKKLLAQAANPDTAPLESYAEGHQVLIIGYNPDTKEIAWTDPWGRDTKERWMTQEEAARCTLGEYYIISW